MTGRQKKEIKGRKKTLFRWHFCDHSLKKQTMFRRRERNRSDVNKDFHGMFWNVAMEKL